MSDQHSTDSDGDGAGETDPAATTEADAEELARQIVDGLDELEELLARRERRRAARAREQWVDEQQRYNRQMAEHKELT